ncbi:hypothetical protein BH10PSE7_BH10PSE7_30460 [soil metagenome]
MDWDRAIAINQAALARIVAALIAMLGLAGGVMPARLERPVYRAVLKVLRPAESAMRRLIVIAARGLIAEARPFRPWREGLALSAPSRACVTFQLFDTRKRFSVAPARTAGPRPEPRIHFFNTGGPLSPLFRPSVEIGTTPAPDDGMVGAARLGRRLAALKMALETLPAQAKRLVRWQARRHRMAAPKFRSPLRPGRPPGYRAESEDEVDRVLRECHALARDVLNTDSS